LIDCAQNGELEKEYAVPGVPRRPGMSADVRRGSVKRQSDIMREARKSRQEEQEEERKRKASYYRRVTGNNTAGQLAAAIKDEYTSEELDSLLLLEQKDFTTRR
jgi:hypothetical protein